MPGVCAIPHAEATTGVDLQVPAITEYLHQSRSFNYKGGSWLTSARGRAKPRIPISIRLSPLTIRAVGEPKMTLEQFWQDNKCLAVWEDE